VEIAIVLLAVGALIAATRKAPPSTGAAAPPAAAPSTNPQVVDTLVKAGTAALGSGLAALGGTTAVTSVSVGTAAPVTASAAAPVASAAGGALVGPIAAAALPVVYILGYIAAGEIVKAQERAKDAQGTLLQAGANARGLNTFEVALITQQLKAWGVTVNEALFRDPRFDYNVLGSKLLVKGYRTQLVALSPDVASKPLWGADLAKLTARTRQAALAYLDERSYFAQKLYKALVPSVSSATLLAIDYGAVLRGTPYEDAAPGAGRLLDVPDPLNGPAAWPSDPNAEPTTAQLRSHSGGGMVAVDCPADVISLARLWAVKDAVLAARLAFPGDTAESLMKRMGAPTGFRASGDWLYVGANYPMTGAADVRFHTHTGEVQGVPETIAAIVPDAVGPRALTGGFLTPVATKTETAIVSFTPNLR